MLRLARRALLPLALFVTIGFFLPWMAIDKAFGPPVRDHAAVFGTGWSGWEMAHDPGASRALFLVPLCGLALAACGAMKRAPIAIVITVGAAIVGITAWCFVRP